MPFEAQNEGALIRRIIRGAYQPVNAPVSPALVQLVRGRRGPAARRSPRALTGPARRLNAPKPPAHTRR
jgi:hypothetical protein